MALRQTNSTRTPGPGRRSPPTPPPAGAGYLRVHTSSRAARRAVGPAAWAVLEEIALLDLQQPPGPELCDRTVEEIAGNLGIRSQVVVTHLEELRRHGLLSEHRFPGAEDGRDGRLRMVVAPTAGISDSREPLGTSVDGARPPSTDNASAPELVSRLVAVGVSAATADALVDEHPAKRVVDALDALDEVRDEVRSPAGWVVAAVREEWNLSDVLVERREQQARERHWQRQREERDRTDAEQGAREALVSAWSAAVSEALDDWFLEFAIDRVTSPVGGLDRRSVPVARTQIVRWAVAASERHPAMTLSDALEHELEMGSISTGSLREPLLDPPPRAARPDDLADRIAAALDARPDLARPREHRESSSRPARPASPGLDRSITR